jgi:hypothetical protein
MLSLLQWDIKIPQTFKFVTAAFNFIIVASYLKFNITIMCRYKIMKQSLWKTNYQSSYTCIFIYISVILKSIYFFLYKFHTFGFILKKYATVVTDMHFSSQYTITKLCLTHAHSLYAVLTGDWCLAIKHDHRSWQNYLQPKRTHTFDYHNSDCLSDNRCFLLLCGLNLYFLLKFRGHAVA